MPVLMSLEKFSISFAFMIRSERHCCGNNDLIIIDKSETDCSWRILTGAIDSW